MIQAGVDSAVMIVLFADIMDSKTTRTNKQGQALGRKGEESRRRLLNATLDLIERDSAHKLSASRIAREAGMSSQSFYIYFRDIEEVLLALAQEAAAGLGDVISTLQDVAPGTPPEVLSTCFVESFSRFWDQHRPILNARNYLADSGNMAFLKLRQETTMPIIRGIAIHIEAALPPTPEAGQIALSRAIVIYQSLERMAARSNAPQYQSKNAPSVNMRKAEIDVLTMLITPMDK